MNSESLFKSIKDWFSPSRGTLDDDPLLGIELQPEDQEAIPVVAETPEPPPVPTAAPSPPPPTTPSSAPLPSFSIDKIGEQLAAEIRKQVPFYRMALAFVDREEETSSNVYVAGAKDPERDIGQDTGLTDTLIGAAIDESGILLSGQEPEAMLERFPDLKSAVDAGIRSIIAVPLQSDDRVAGVVVLESNEESAYQFDHLESTKQVSDAFVQAVAGTKDYISLKERVRELSELADLAGVVTSSQDRADVIDRFAGKIVSLLPYDRLEVAEIDAKGSVATLIYARGIDVEGWEEGHEFLLEGTVLDKIAAGGSAVVDPGESSDTLANLYPTESAIATEGLRAVLALPLKSGEDVVGALTFRSTSPRAFSTRDIGLGQQAAAILATVMSSTVQVDVPEAPSLEETTLSAIAREVGQPVPAEAMFSSIADLVHSLVPFETLVVAMLDSEARTATNTYAAGAEVQGWGTGESLTLDEAAIDTLSNNMDAVTASEETADALSEKLPAWSLLGAAGTSSLLAVPVASQGAVYAGLIFATATPGAYDDSHVDLAKRIGESIGGPIAAARERAEIETDLEQARVLNDVGREVGASSGLDDARDRTIGLVQNLIPVDDIAFHSVDFEAGTATRLGLDTEGDSEPVTGTALQDPVQSGTTVISDDGSSIVVPTKAGDTVVATTTFSASAGTYSEDQVATTQLVAAPFSALLTGIHSRQRTEDLGDESHVLDEIGRFIATASTVEDVYDGLPDMIRRLIAFERLDFAFLDDDGEGLTRTHFVGVEVGGTDVGEREPLVGRVEEEAIRTAAPFQVQIRFPADTEAQFPSMAADVDAGLRSFMAVPLISGGEVVGAMSFSSKGSTAYSDDDLATAERFGFQLAGIVARSRLETGHVPTSEEQRILAEIGRTATSSVDVNEVYDDLAEQVHRIIPYERIAVWTVDLQRQQLVASYVFGGTGAEEEMGKSFSLGTKQEGADSDGDDTNSYIANHFHEIIRKIGTSSPDMLLVPLESQDGPVGMLSLKALEGHKYTQKDVAVAERVAAQVGGPIANAQVYLELKRVQDEVKIAVERLDLAVWGSADGLWDWKPLEAEMWWSPRFKELVGYHEANGYGGLEEWQSRIHPDDRDRVVGSWRSHLEGQGEYDEEYRFRTYNEEYRWFSDRGHAVWDDDENVVRISGSLRDITLAREMGVTTGSGSYDLRLPLVAVDGFRRTLVHAPTSDDVVDRQEYLDALVAESGRLSHLFDDLRNLDVISKKSLKKENVDLSTIARSAARKLRRSQPQRQVTFSIASGVTARGDDRLLRVLLEELLDNSWKFTGRRRKPRIEFGTTEIEGDTVYFVGDNGAGFDMADYDRLFGLFMRLHSMTEFEGTGVGLSTVRTAVRRHGGNIWAEASPGKGATFFFTLP